MDGPSTVALQFGYILRIDMKKGTCLATELSGVITSLDQEVTLEGARLVYTLHNVQTNITYNITVDEILPEGEQTSDQSFDGGVN